MIAIIFPIALYLLIYDLMPQWDLWNTTLSRHPFENYRIVYNWNDHCLWRQILGVEHAHNKTSFNRCDGPIKCTRRVFIVTLVLDQARILLYPPWLLWVVVNHGNWYPSITSRQNTSAASTSPATSHGMQGNNNSHTVSKAALLWPRNRRMSKLFRKMT